MDVNWVTHIPGCPKKFNEARTTFCGKLLETIISEIFPQIFGGIIGNREPKVSRSDLKKMKKLTLVSIY